MDIRRALPGDAALLAALNRHVHDLHVTIEPQVYRATAQDEVAAWFRARLGSGEVALVAQEGDEPLGYVLARLVDGPGHLFKHPQRFLLVHQLAVAEGARRGGVGRALMAAIEAHAVASGVGSIELDVRAANAEALAFYAALGYRTEQLHLCRQLER